MNESDKLIKYRLDKENRDAEGISGCLIHLTIWVIGGFLMAALYLGIIYLFPDSGIQQFTDNTLVSTVIALLSISLTSMLLTRLLRWWDNR